MAFMMPVMKNQYNIYPCRSRNSSMCSTGSRSRTVSESAKSDVLSTSPQSTTSDPPVHRHHNYILARGTAPASRNSRSHSQDSDEDTRDSSSGSSDPALPSSPSKTGSMSSLQKFHSKLVDKLRRKFKGSSGKANGGDDEDGEDEGAKSGRSSS